MRRSVSLSVLAVALTSLVFVACGDDDPAPAPGGETGKAGSAGAAAGGSAGAAAGGSAGAAAGGSDAGGSAGAAAGGSDAGGAAGAAAGGAAGAAAGGAAGAAAGGSAGAAASDPQVDLAGCTFAGATDGTAAATAKIVVAKDGGFTYTPNCLKVKVGTVVTFEGNSATHPLRPFTAKGTLPNPIPSTSDATATATFATKGAFGYFCQNHGNDGSTAGMVGAIYVVELSASWNRRIDEAETLRRSLGASPADYPVGCRPGAVVIALSCCRFERSGFPCTLLR